MPKPDSPQYPIYQNEFYLMSYRKDGPMETPPGSDPDDWRIHSTHLAGSDLVVVWARQVIKKS